MRAVAATIAMLLVLISVAPVSATMRINDDSGGQIGAYLDKYQALRASGDKVIIDGTCASACTMVLGAIPHDRICVTPRAVLAFHSAWLPTSEGEQVSSSAGNSYLWSNYPGAVRKWITAHGGLHSRIIYLSGPELTAMYPLCR